MILMLGGGGCEQGVCGVGTVDRNGVCEAVVNPPGPPTCCGPGTYFEPTILQCAPEYPPMECDSESAIEVPGPDGVIDCIGTGMTECGPIPCPVPSGGKLSVCGRLHDIETSQPIVGANTGAACDPDVPEASGPCALELQFYDALQFAGDPTGATPLPYDRLRVNDCGYFAAENIPAPALGFLGIGVDDAGSADSYALSGVAIASVAGAREPDLTLYATRRTTDEMWTTSAENPYGASTFSEHGVYVAIFLDENGPVEGVVVTQNGSPQPASDYYFSDTDPLMRSTVDTSLTSTGPNGTALLGDSQLVNHSGTGGGIPANCQWPSNLADAIPGVVFIQERHLVCN